MCEIILKIHYLNKQHSFDHTKSQYPKLGRHEGAKSRRPTPFQSQLDRACLTNYPVYVAKTKCLR